MKSISLGRFAFGRPGMRMQNLAVAARAAFGVGAKKCESFICRQNLDGPGMAILGVAMLASTVGMLVALF